MNTFIIEDIHDIEVDTDKAETRIDFKNFQGAVSRLELARKDAELFYERLGQALKKVK
jgi:hypothetical protein